MSPRKRYITVEEWPPLRKSELYKGVVKSIASNRKGKKLDVTIENLDPTQLGRIHQLTLPLPIHPGSTTSLFLSACGTDASHIGKRVCLDDVVGATVGMIFGSDLSDDEQIDFKKIDHRTDMKADKQEVLEAD